MSKFTIEIMPTYWLKSRDFKSLTDACVIRSISLKTYSRQVDNRRLVPIPLLQTTNMFKNRLPWFLIEPPKCKNIKAISLSGKIKSGKQSFKANLKF